MFSFGMGMVLLMPKAISSILKLGAMMVLIKADFISCAIHWTKVWNFDSPAPML